MNHTAHYMLFISNDTSAFQLPDPNHKNRKKKIQTKSQKLLLSVIFISTNRTRLNAKDQPQHIHQKSNRRRRTHRHTNHWSDNSEASRDAMAEWYMMSWNAELSSVFFRSCFAFSSVKQPSANLDPGRFGSRPESAAVLGFVAGVPVM